MMEVQEAIRMKRAVRVFTNTPLAQESIDTILQAGRRAQSAKNAQPWHFVAIRDKDILKALSNCGTYAGHLAGAALGVAILTPDPAQRWSIMFDAGQAAAYMQLAAWSLGIGSCLATIYETEMARQVLAIPADLHLHVAISFGYPADIDDLTRTPKVGGRKDFEALIHQETW
jgi:nitroreductase